MYFAFASIGPSCIRTCAQLPARGTSLPGRDDPCWRGNTPHRFQEGAMRAWSYSPPRNRHAAAVCRRAWESGWANYTPVRECLAVSALACTLCPQLRVYCCIAVSEVVGPVSRVPPVQTAMRNCTRDEGRPFVAPG